MQNEKNVKRYALLDELRGLDFISMVCYHSMWDLVYIFGVQAEWYKSWAGFLWQQTICWVFIMLSGFCVPLGRHTLRRGAVVFAAGALVTLVTELFMPEDVVRFGVLTLIGSAMLITGALDKYLRRVPPAVGLAVCAALIALTYNSYIGYWGFGAFKIVLPRAWFANYFTAYLGFFPEDFFSTDYFPLLPWLFVFMAGYFAHFLVGRGRMEPLRRSVCAPLGWLGRHSLIIYLLHQPVIYGVFTVFFMLLRA